MSKANNTLITPAANTTAKVVFFTVLGTEISIIVLSEHYKLFLEALLKVVFRTVRTVDIEWPAVAKKVTDDRPAPTRKRVAITTCWWEGRRVFCKVNGVRHRHLTVFPNEAKAALHKERVTRLGVIMPEFWEKHK